MPTETISDKIHTGSQSVYKSNISRVLGFYRCGENLHCFVETLIFHAICMKIQKTAQQSLSKVLSQKYFVYWTVYYEQKSFSIDTQIL